MEPSTPRQRTCPAHGLSFNAELECPKCVDEIMWDAIAQTEQDWQDDSYDEYAWSGSDY